VVIQDDFLEKWPL